MKPERMDGAQHAECVKNKTAMSCGFMGLCPQNAVILRLCPSRPSAHEAERMDGAQHAECVKNKTAMSCGFMGLCPQNAVILHLCPARPSAHEAERMDGAQHVVDSTLWREMKNPAEKNPLRPGALFLTVSSLSNPNLKPA
jgi:hypothetical protein